MSRRLQRMGLLGVIAAFVPLLPLDSPAATLSMQEFLTLQPQWEELADKGELLRIEGRVESSSPRLVRMRKCPLPFRPVEGQTFQLPRNPGRVEAVGKLGRRGSELVFFATELKEQPSDLQVYALRESALDARYPNRWYELAAWAEKQGTFYDDRDLLEKAHQARRQGLALERITAAGDAAALRELGHKAGRLGLDQQRDALIHESLRVRWDELRTDRHSNLAPLLREIQQSLAGATESLSEWPDDLAARYAAEPLAVYNRAHDDERPLLDRLFFAEVQLAAIERGADPDGANGTAMARRIESVLPERSDLAERYRERETQYRLNRIEAATRSEVLDLARRLEAQGRADEARRALTTWLAAREATLREDGPGGLVVAAEDYAAVLGDKVTAARLLIEALKASPESEVIPEKLRQLGYVPLDGIWMTKEDAAARPVDPVTQAMREGRVTLGMSPEQVRKTLGMPDRIARVASTAQIHETWVYGESGRSGVTVHFLRYSARGPDEGRVVGVATLGR
jgi:hypothetical protein